MDKNGVFDAFLRASCAFLSLDDILYQCGKYKRLKRSFHASAKAALLFINLCALLLCRFAIFLHSIFFIPYLCVFLTSFTFSWLSNNNNIINI